MEEDSGTGVVGADSEDFLHFLGSNRGAKFGKESAAAFGFGKYDKNVAIFGSVDVFGGKPAGS